jgi:hypothetical protein
MLDLNHCNWLHELRRHSIASSYVPLKTTLFTLTEINTNQSSIIGKCSVYTFLFWLYIATTFYALVFNSWLDNLCLKYFYVIKHFASNFNGT